MRKHRKVQVEEHRVILGYPEWHGWSLFFQSLFLCPSVSEQHSSHRHKSCSVLSVKLQLIHSLLKNCPCKILLPMPLSRPGCQIQLTGEVSSFLTTLIYKPEIASLHSALHQRRGCWQQIAPVCGIRVLQRGDPCIKSNPVHRSAGWGVIYSHPELSSFCFIPDFHTPFSLMFYLCINELGRDLALLCRWCCCPWWDKSHPCPRRTRNSCLLRRCSSIGVLVEWTI